MPPPQRPAVLLLITDVPRIMPVDVSIPPPSTSAIFELMVTPFRVV
jgi:hypothetical protein